MFRQIVLERKEQPLVVQPISSKENSDTKRSLRIREGLIQEYKISWIPFGHSLGRVVYSLPLAPYESIDLAVIDWSRTDEAQRGEDLTVSEQLIHNQRRDRTIEETVIAGLDEWQRGGSVMGGLQGSYNAGTEQSVERQAAHMQHLAETETSQPVPFRESLITWHRQAALLEIYTVPL